MSGTQQFSGSDALGKAQDYARDNGDQVSGMIDKAQEALSNATGGKFDGAIEKGADLLEDRLGVPEQTGSAPQEGVEQTDTTAPEAPVPGDTPTPDPSDPAEDDAPLG